MQFLTLRNNSALLLNFEAAYTSDSLCIKNPSSTYVKYTNCKHECVRECLTNFPPCYSIDYHLASESGGCTGVVLEYVIL